MPQSPTQKRRYSGATWLYDVAIKGTKAARKLAKQWKMQADAADRRVEKRKSRTNQR